MPIDIAQWLQQQDDEILYETDADGYPSPPPDPGDIDTDRGEIPAPTPQAASRCPGPEVWQATHPMTDDDTAGAFTRAWPDPTPEDRASEAFARVWECIKRWDVSVADAYPGYCGANGAHVRAILDALRDLVQRG